MSLFSCDSCSELIRAEKPRIHCQICQDYDVCANCFVVGSVTSPHEAYHPTELVKTSGLESKGPPVPPRVSPSVTSSTTSIPRRAVTPETRPTMPPRPPSNTSQSNTSQGPATGRGPTVTNEREQYASPPPTSSGSSGSGSSSSWKSLFDGNTPTQQFLDLLNVFFDILDKDKSGYLTPEVYSSFLDAQGYKSEDNVWKKNLKPTFGQNREDIADAEWKTTLDNFSIDHIMKQRPGAGNHDMANLTNQFSHLYGSAMQNIMSNITVPSVSGGLMPLISRRGFIDITALETLYDPSVGWGNLNRAIQNYGIWKAKGPIPRDALPQFPPQSVLNQVAHIRQLAEYRAQETLDAVHAKHKIEQRGRQAALDLLDDRRYRYY